MIARDIHIRTVNFYFFLLVSLLLVILFLLDIYLGSVKIPFTDFFSFITGREVENGIAKSIFIAIRIPKAVAAILAGSALAVSGLQMQTIFRNPLAGPYVLGISSGASLGVAIVVLGFSALTIPAWISQLTIAAAAMIGSLVVLLVVLLVSVRIKDNMTILILGMMFGSGASAIVSILQYFSNETLLKSFVIWTMGSLGSVTGIQIWFFALIVILGLGLAIILSRPLNVILIGDNYARTLGVKIGTTRFLVFLSTSMLAGATTAFCGPIGFIGIAVPHVVKIILRTSNHFILIPAVILAGSGTMLFCDIISQLPGLDFTIPVNSVTALLGIPVVVYVVLKNKRIVSS